jgi:hypothetical protein
MGSAMKGKSPTAAQKRFHDALCRDVGCVACRLDGIGNFNVSVHHIDGRTKPDAHWLVLPLCAGHHQDGTGAPGLIAVHPWKARFESEYGRQRDLLIAAIEVLQARGHVIPDAALAAAGMLEAA